MVKASQIHNLTGVEGVGRGVKALINCGWFGEEFFNSLVVGSLVDVATFFKKVKNVHLKIILAG